MQNKESKNQVEPEYIYDEEILRGLSELLSDKATIKMMSITPEEIEWLKTVIIEGKRVWIGLIGILWLT